MSCLHLKSVPSSSDPLFDSSSGVVPPSSSNGVTGGVGLLSSLKGEDDIDPHQPYYSATAAHSNDAQRNESDWNEEPDDGGAGQTLVARWKRFEFRYMKRWFGGRHLDRVYQQDNKRNGDETSISLTHCDPTTSVPVGGERVPAPPASGFDSCDDSDSGDEFADLRMHDVQLESTALPSMATPASDVILGSDVIVDASSGSNTSEP